MRVSIHQPTFLPWSGLFHKILSADVHVFYSSAQFNKRGYQNRVFYNDSWLTIPVCMKGIQDSENHVIPIMDIKFSNFRYNMEKIIRRIETSEKKKPFFSRLDKILDFLHKSLLCDEETLKLTDVTIPLTKIICRIVSHSNNVRFLELKEVLENGSPASKIDKILSKTWANTYLSGKGAMEYLEREKLKVPILYQEQVKEVDAGSIISILTSESSPYDYIMSRFRWVVK